MCNAIPVYIILSNLIAKKQTKACTSPTNPQTLTSPPKSLHVSEPPLSQHSRTPRHFLNTHRHFLKTPEFPIPSRKKKKKKTRITTSTTFRTTPADRKKLSDNNRAHGPKKQRRLKAQKHDAPPSTGNGLMAPRWLGDVSCASTKI